MDSLLIVDDNMELLCLYKKFISHYGKYDIAGMAGNGKDAIIKYKKMKKKPDLVLMDVNMPDIDGISAAKEIQRYDKKANIIFVTAEQIYHSDLPPELSDTDILRKPFSRAEFISAIAKALRKHPADEN
ncbi:MAG TPA: response regulator [Methanocella sp.]|uniref:LytR/AlgR family response regulator transcription factor n=1 Tax=Methanocella sp. TaxID=2052833 RepID=UPI002C382AB8|nr:response regulator [Methanocella sp.]HTY89683.1 response regulator [Methanocella sp.]